MKPSNTAKAINASLMRLRAALGTDREAQALREHAAAVDAAHQAEARSYRILSVPDRTYRHLAAIANLRGSTITDAVNFVLAGFAEGEP